MKTQTETIYRKQVKLLCKSVTVKPDTVIDSVRADPAATGRCFISAEAFLNFGEFVVTTGSLFVRMEDV